MTRGLVALLVLLTGAPALAASLGDADRAWIEACAGRLKNERGTAESKVKYCTCMHEQFDDNREVDQTEMERLYPPLHRECQIEAGRGR
ncbi:MAG TPA: hypothetical protein VNR39_06185 [Pseudolabrys sp.]|nr:hypothetical protein [Pseudolabrys sp.]